MLELGDDRGGHPLQIPELSEGLPEGPSPSRHFLSFFFFLRFYLFIFREREGREKKRERNINVRLLLVHPSLGTLPAT